MRIISCLFNQAEQLGLFYKERYYLTSELSESLPLTMDEFLKEGEEAMNQLAGYQQKLEQDENVYPSHGASELTLLAPVPYPGSFRDAYAFRQHVETSRRNRGLEMIPEFDLFPVFYFSNHRAIFGSGRIDCLPHHFEKLDFELEVALVINKKGRNIPASKADEYIAGFMILNDLSARKIQMDEMKLNLGPAKGKDFASAIGPYLVTKDELTAYEVDAPEGHVGICYDLPMRCSVNGVEVSSGNLASMHWTFAEIIERASDGVDLFPGDLIGSGTVGTGCFLELNGTGKLNDPNYAEQWLQPGDEVVMEVEGLGTLSNTVSLVSSQS
ncbi:fumarylacetoacetate hydrolase family protein [Sphingobacterium hungaricum]|uniref:Fumarylacetoacetate hydrolase n=1 Tax=Sphingobacterium hungaricum TaxID=2082723 RepID=A0A928UYY4_9SPHI|nr:fumarylacetoacetate hydrolase family protein [Sphingobacterium hungaricum]MBE8715237.1 fumarylacetoacetate hydrolase [Sphingobacterium hungaricum]